MFFVTSKSPSVISETFIIYCKINIKNLNVDVLEKNVLFQSGENLENI